MLDSNPGHLVSETTTLPTLPQPLPNCSSFKTETIKFFEIQIWLA